MQAETALSLLVPLVVLALLWTLVRHWVLPFVLGFALAVALGPSARPIMAAAWDVVAEAGRAVFGSTRAGRDEVRPADDRDYLPREERRPERYPERERYDERYQR